MELLRGVHGAVLGVSTLQYPPYALFNIASPVLSVAYGFTGFRIEHVDPADAARGPARPRARQADGTATEAVQHGRRR